METRSDEEAFFEALRRLKDPASVRVNLLNGTIAKPPDLVWWHDESGPAAALRAALKRSMTAIDDWLNTYAPEFCDEKRVAEARERLGEYGTIGYIAYVQEQNRNALALNGTEATGWQPIETAPKDGSEVLVCKPFMDGWAHYVVFWLRDKGWTVWSNAEGWELAEPTHWMPLPAPPTPKSPS